MSKIAKILAREIIDSRGNPTVEVEAHLEGDLSVWPLRHQGPPPVHVKR